MDPIDKSRCSFPIPDFASDDEERAWVASLTPTQRFELLHLMLLARHGEAVLSRGMDRSVFQVLTMEEFNKMKDREDKAEERWRLQYGWPARIPILREQLLAADRKMKNRASRKKR